MDPLWLGLVLAVVISAGAYAARALSFTGAAAAVLLGTVVFAWGGLDWAVLLVAFFVSSSGLSRLFKRQKLDLTQVFSKGGRRDAGQVLANGGAAAIFAVLMVVFPAERAWWWAAYAGSLAAVNADTWATELGVLSRGEPRDILSGRRVARGTSGGISAVGTLAALGGALFMGGLAALLKNGSLFFALGVAAAGLVGSLVDSALGAACQAIYYCPDCQKETEHHPRHSCGNMTRLRRGWGWMNNDVVNFVCAISGAAIAVLLIFIFQGL